jgi:hypothetical protein
MWWVSMEFWPNNPILEFDDDECYVGTFVISIEGLYWL